MAKALIATDQIAGRIVVLRGEKVLLDSDLAELYAVPTRRFNEQVKRNIARFPSDFMVQLTAQEFTPLEVANCDLKHRPRFQLGRAALPALCFLPNTERSWRPLS